MAVIYRTMIKSLDKLVPPILSPYWNHAAGPKTVFFWAPTIKWGLVIAGLGDMTRSADKLSVSQSGALAVTGTIWSRYCFVIIPRSYYLVSVNVFVACTGYYQLFKIYMYQQDQKKKALEQ